MSAVIQTPVDVQRVSLDDWPLLAQMYEEFPSSSDSLGLPPRDRAQRTTWLDRFRREGINFVAWVDELIVGHLVLMPSEVVAEMAVFVRADYRRRGVAWALTKAAVKEARKRGLRSLWVLVSSNNSPALVGLPKFGFQVAWESMGEVQLIYRL